MKERVKSKENFKVKYRRVVKKGRQYRRTPEEYWHDLKEKTKMIQYEDSEIEITGTMTKGRFLKLLKHDDLGLKEKISIEESIVHH